MIDWSRVQELVSEIGADGFDEIVELFLDEVEMSIARLEQAAGDPVVVEEQMHFLKGAAMNLGFEMLAQLCLKGERAAAAGRPDVVAADEVRRIYDASHTRFAADLPKQLAA